MCSWTPWSYDASHWAINVFVKIKVSANLHESENRIKSVVVIIIMTESLPLLKQMHGDMKKENK